MGQGNPPNYYAILEVPETATDAQIRDGYKKAALKTHPDRVPANSPERAERTRKFQLVNDAYFTLSDPARRRDYDAERKLFSNSTSGHANNSHRPPASDPFDEADEEIPPQGDTGTGQSAYSWAWNFFTNQNNNNNNNAGRTREQAEQEQFEDVFEEMMRDEGMAENETNRPTKKFWGLLGGASGAALGFIVANVPGLVAGAVAGNRLGAVRDAKGKSVYAVFQELPPGDRSRLLSQLAARVFSHAVGV